MTKTREGARRSRETPGTLLVWWESPGRQGGPWKPVVCLIEDLEVAEALGRVGDSVWRIYRAVPDRAEHAGPGSPGYLDRAAHAVSRTLSAIADFLDDLGSGAPAEHGLIDTAKEKARELRGIVGDLDESLEPAREPRDESKGGSDDDEGTSRRSEE